MEIYVLNISCKTMYTCKTMKEYKFEEIYLTSGVGVINIRRAMYDLNVFPQSNITTTNTDNKYWPIVDDPPESLDAGTYLRDQS